MRHTRSIIKDSMLELLKKTSYDKITIAMLCRAAQIGRTTFYNHYDDLSEVLDELGVQKIILTFLDGGHTAIERKKVRNGREKGELASYFWVAIKPDNVYNITV